MYLESFGLRIAPFSMTSDPAMLFLSASHREALAGLCYGLLDRKGLLVVLGQAGTGKTTLLTKAVQALPATRIEFATILNPMLTAAEFLESVLLGFGIEEIPASKPQRLLRLQHRLLEVQAEGRVAALVIDEAHKLSVRVFEEVRLLGNLEHESQKLLQLVLAGQSDLAGILNRGDLLQLKQRIAGRLSLRPLSRAEVAEYIRHRWVRAGGTLEAPFSPAALELAARLSHGIPRVVNAICDNALLLVFGERAALVEPRHVAQSAADLDLIEAAVEPQPLPEPVPRLAPAESAAAAVSTAEEQRTLWAKWANWLRLAS
jgi:general secretion pathway protein A